jgi:hypothetical protein
MKEIQARITKPVKVSISLDLKGEPIVKPNHITLTTDEKNEIYWKCEYQDKLIRIEILFEKEDSPFRYYAYRCAKGAGCLSGVPLANKAREKPYQYTLKIIKSDPKVRSGSETVTNVKAYVTVK